MARALVLAALTLIVPFAAAAQEPSVLHIKITLAGADRKPTPVARHTLLISENPTSAPPRAVVTGADGTADVRLRAGNYTVESDQPVVFEGNAYEWTQLVDVVAGRDVTLELTSANAENVPLTTAAPASSSEREPDLALLARWQDSVVALWTPTAHASGFVAGPNGLIATNQRVVGGATRVEVQLTADVKVPGSVVVADGARDVALVRIDPAAAAPLRAISLGCEQPENIKRSGQELVAIGAPLRQPKGPAFGEVERVNAHSIITDFILPAGSAGGPVFTQAGAFVGMTSVDDEKSDERLQNSRVVSVADVCEVIAASEKKVSAATPPGGAHLPVEPSKPFPESAIAKAAEGHTRSVAPYQLSASDFDVTFITPVMTYGAQLAERASRPRGASPQALNSSFFLTEFANWSEYVGDLPPVLFVRVTPKLVEGFWTKVGRGAARTQGMALPPFKKPKSAFARLRAVCGDAEVTPIHPLMLEHRLPGIEAIDEGLYVFDPGALSPSCGTVKLEIYSDKEPGKADSRVVDPKIVEQVWSDFESYRALK